MRTAKIVVAVFLVVLLLGMVAAAGDAEFAAAGAAAGDNGTRIMYREIAFEGVDDTFDGTLVMTYDPGQGFFLENSFSYSDEELKFVGEYLTDKNTGGEMASGGILRSNMRVQIRSSGATMWVAEAYTHIDGKEVLVQSYRFTRQ